MKNIRPKNGLFGAGVLAATVVLCSLLVLLGCRNPLDWRDAPESVNGTGAIALTVNGQGMGRTIMPSLPGGDFNFHLEFESIDGYNDDFSRSWGGEGLVELPVGQWRLRVTSYIPDTAGRREIARSDWVEVPVTPRREIARSDWVEIPVTPGAPVERNVMLAPIDEGYGTFSWDINFPTDVVAARMRVMRIDNGTPAFDENFVLRGNDATGLTSYELPVGLYRVIFTLSGANGASAEIGKILHIHQNLESRFTDDERLFADFIFPTELLQTILSAWNDTGWNFDLGNDRRITAGHFALLPVNGVNNDNLSSLVEQFDWLSTGTNAANRPTDKAGLEALIDAALVRMALADPALNRANNAWEQPYGEAIITYRVQNIDPEVVGLAWGTGEQYYNVTVTIGGFVFPVAFIPVPVTGVTIHGPPTHHLTIDDDPLPLTATVVPSDARNQGITWDVYDLGGTTAEVSADGIVTLGTTAGAAEIRATSVGNPGESARVTVNVSTDVIHIEDLAIYNADFSLNVGAYVDLQLVFTPSNTTQRDVTFTFDSNPPDPDNVTVDWEDGQLRVRGVVIGTTTVTVTSVANDTLYDTVVINVIAIPTSVEVTPDTASVPRNRTRHFGHTVHGPAGVTQIVEWSIYPESAGTVTGGLLALDPSVTIGSTVTVTATVTAHGVTEYGSATVTVLRPEPDYVEIDQGAEITLERDDYAHPNPRFEFTATVLPEGAPEELMWSIVSPIPPGADITPAGALAIAHPLAHGDTFTVRATAVADPSLFTDIVVTVDVTPTGVAITSPTPPVSIVRGGEPLPFVAVVQPVGSPQNVEWSVYPQPTGVSISANGILTVTATAGIAYDDELTVTARVPGTQFDDTVTVTVTVSPTGVTITSPEPPVSIERGASQVFAATVEPAGASQSVGWEVSGGGSFVGNVLTVDANAVPGSELTVTASALGAYPPVTSIVTVIVTTPPPSAVSVSPLAAYIERSQTQDFTAQVTPLTALQDVVWSVYPEREGVSIVSQGLHVGRLTISGNADVRDGDELTVTVRVTQNTSITNTARVTVRVPPTGVTINPHTTTMIRGGATQSFTATVHPTGAAHDVEWSVSTGGSFDGNVLTVPVGTEVGSVLTITATVPGTAHTDTATVTVTSPAPTSVTVATDPPMTPITIVRGGALQFRATVIGPPGYDNRVTWSVLPQSADVSIDPQTGLLTVGADTTVTALTVRASAVGHEEAWYGTAAVTVQEGAGFGITLPAFPPAGIIPDIDGPTFGILELPRTINVTNYEDFSSIRWFFDGREIGTNPIHGSTVSDNGASLTIGPRIHGTLLDIGTHILTVEVTRLSDGEPHSRRISFTVTP